MPISATYECINVVNCSDHEPLSPTLYMATTMRRAFGYARELSRLCSSHCTYPPQFDVVTLVSTATAHVSVRQRVSCPCFLVSFPPLPLYSPFVSLLLPPLLYLAPMPKFEHPWPTLVALSSPVPEFIKDTQCNFTGSPPYLRSGSDSVFFFSAFRTALLPHTHFTLPTTPLILPFSTFHLSPFPYLSCSSLPILPIPIFFFHCHTFPEFSLIPSFPRPPCRCHRHPLPLPL